MYSQPDTVHSDLLRTCMCCYKRKGTLYRLLHSSLCSGVVPELYVIVDALPFFLMRTFSTYMLIGST